MGELETLEWDIICFSETRAKDDLIELQGGHLLLTCLKGQLFAGVGILIHKKMIKQIRGYHRLSGRICGIDLKCGHLCVRIISVYVPCGGHDWQEVEAFYEELRILMDGAVRHGMRIILAGDFNTEVGRGERGMALQNILSGYGLMIFNQSGNDGIERFWTHKSSTGILRQIDFIIGDINFEIKDSFASKTLDLGSDHRAVFAEVYIKK